VAAGAMDLFNNPVGWRNVMRIFEQNSDMSFDNITILLTVNEAGELKDKLNCLINDYGKKERHEHISDDDYQHEITIAIYNKDNLAEFNRRMRRLIFTGK
jgi:hypothetical protein